MTSYSLDISFYWLIAVLLIVLAIIFSVYYYIRTVPPISNRKKVILIILRSLGLILLLFALFEPVLTITSGKIISPKIAVLLDNSVSVSLKDAGMNRKEVYKNAINSINFSKLNAEDIYFSIFDFNVRQIENFSFDSLNFQGQHTDLSKPFRWALEKSEKDNIQAIIMITDGAFNTGSNPLYDAEILGKPVFVVGIGDTTEPKDISIQSIITNEIAYLNKAVPINVNFNVAGFGNTKIKLALLENNQKFHEEEININSERKDYTAVVEYIPKSEGIKKITAFIEPLKGEITDRNNTISEFIEVLKHKKEIAIFCGSLNPDVSFIKNELQKEEGISVKTYIQKKDAEFYEPAPTSVDITRGEIFVFIGFPVTSTPNNILLAIKKELEKGKPLFFVASAMTDYTKLKLIEEFLPFTTISSRQNEFLATPDVKIDAITNPLIRIYGNEEDINIWNRLPPLFRTETFVRIKPESELVSSIKVNNVPLREPLIVMRHFQDKKSVALLGYGLYRWKLLSYSAEVAKQSSDAVDVVAIFIQNVINWLSISDASRQIKIKTTKNNYSIAEDVEFIAQVYDAAYNPIDNAKVVVKLSGEKEKREILLNSISNGRYVGKISNLPAGDYAFNGEAFVENKSIGTDKGRFSVGQIVIEYQNLKMNYPLLQSLADRTGGKFYKPTESGNIIQDILNHPRFLEQSVKTRSDFYIWDMIYLMAFAILCFAIEWYIRKKSSML